MPKELLVKEVMNTGLAYLEKNNTVYDAAKLIVEKNVSSVLILDKGALRGIVTTRDMAQKIVYHQLNPQETTLSQIMSSPVHTIDSEKTIVDAARMMRDMGFKKLVVVKGREVVGILTDRDIIEVLPALYDPDLPHMG
jgi:CBS domain-containing protein